jgi:predicted PurR-regulated permease PerM
MLSPEPDKTGLHILIKLSALVIILAGIHAAADIIVQLLLALFFAIVLNPLVTWLIRRGVNRPLAISMVVFAMLVVLTMVVGVLAASMSEFIDMLPKYNKMLTQKVFELEKMLPFMHLRLSPERMLQRMDSEKVMSYATTLMTGLSGAMASILLLVMTVVFMLFEVRHVPYKLRFAPFQPENSYRQPAPRTQRCDALSGAKNAHQPVDRSDYLAWPRTAGRAICIDVGRVGILAQLHPQYRFGNFRYSANDSGVFV